MSDDRSLDVSLISHTNAGKTTLARTLLGRDVGEVLITSGVSGGLFLAILATIDPGDEAVLPFVVSWSFPNVLNYFDVVPEQTSPWKPEQAPHAMVTKRNGKRASPFPDSQATKAGYSTGIPPKSRPTRPTARKP